MRPSFWLQKGRFRSFGVRGGFFGLSGRVFSQVRFLQLRCLLGTVTKAPFLKPFCKLKYFVPRRFTSRWEGIAPYSHPVWCLCFASRSPVALTRRAPCSSAPSAVVRSPRRPSFVATRVALAALPVALVRYVACRSHTARRDRNCSETCEISRCFLLAMIFAVAIAASVP